MSILNNEEPKPCYIMGSNDRKIDMTQTRLSPAQSRVLQLIDELIDPGATWPGRPFFALPQSQRPRPTIDALLRLGMIQQGVKRMGGGIYHGYWTLTEAGKHHVSSLPPR
jgi:hypothetical protein